MIIDVITRLKSQCPILKNRVEVAKSLTLLEEDQSIGGVPLVRVFPYRVIPGENQMLGKQVSQQRYIQTGINIIAVNSDGISDYLSDARKEIETALLGWQINDKHAPIFYTAGDAVDVSGGLILWRDIYSTWNFLTN